MIREDYKFQEGDHVKVTGKVQGQHNTGIVKSTHGPHQSFVVVDHGNGDVSSYHDTDLSHHEDDLDEAHLHELSKGTLASYVKKAGEDQVDTFASKSFRSGRAGDKYNKADDDHRTQKRSEGIQRALNKLIKEMSSYKDFKASLTD